MVMQTERLKLRRMRVGDLQNLLGILSDEVAMTFYPSTYSEEETRKWIQRNLDRYERYGFGLWIVERKETGEFLGQCGLVVQQVEGVEEIEIGYLFLRKWWRHGFATEAACACRDYGFHTLGFERLISIIDPENIASRRVAEKVGMKVEGEVELWGRWMCLYSMKR
jgi:RimJ/RimL family protein N-acetyltransferase